MCRLVNHGKIKQFTVSGFDHKKTCGLINKTHYLKNGIMKFHYGCYEYQNCAKCLLNHDSCVRLMKFGRLSRIQLINYDNSYITPVTVDGQIIELRFKYFVSKQNFYLTMSVVMGWVFVMTMKMLRGCEGSIC